jgi:hypothetical protein
MYTYSPDLQVKFSFVHLSVLFFSCRMARRKIMLNTKEMFLLGEKTPRKLLLLISRKLGIRCLKNVKRLSSARGEAVGELEPRIDPFIRYGETPSFLFGSNPLLRGNPDRAYCLCYTNASTEDNPKKRRHCDSGKTLGAGNPDGSCFLCGTNASLGYDPRKGRYCNTRNPSTARKPRWSVFSVLYENPK